MENIIGLSTNTCFPDPRISTKILHLTHLVVQSETVPHIFGTVISAGTQEWTRERESDLIVGFKL